MIEKYYEEELRYLYESGREFAKAHPDRARFLNIDAVGDRDPYVERLFEGFAFLAARIREKLDDSFPELTEGLVALMWPAIMQEIPSLAITEFKPRQGLLQETRELQRGVEVLSNPVGAESAICRFITTQTVRLNPIELVALERAVDTKGRETLTFRFQLEASIDWYKLSLFPIRLFLHSEMPTALLLHQYLTRRVVSARLDVNDGVYTEQLDPDSAVTPGGLSPEESLLPHDSRAFWGYNLLLEYFAYPEKFLFVDFHGLEQMPVLDPSPTKFSYSLTFDSEFPANRHFAVDNFRLHCAPVVNVFRRDIEPILNTGKETEYRVIADSTFPRSVKVHSICSVGGVDRSTGERYPYQPFHAFNALGAKLARAYSSRYRRGPDGRRDLFLSVGGEQLTGGELRQESLSIEAWCTNGMLPREEIGDGGLTKGGSGFPDYIRVTNITRPTLPFTPPDEDDYLWVFLSHLGATYTSLSSVDALKSFLRLYDWSQSEGRRRRIEAIAQVESQPIEEVVGGSAVRGIEFRVSLTEAEFQDVGDLHLFGEVLKEFLGHYVTVNSFLRLTFILKPSGALLQWDTLKGKRWPI